VANAGEFRLRASHEARRYGGDAWVFVRELLQNSRDAGATKVDITVERRGGVDRFVCRDDGCGMSFEHAQKYLFTLYASSKRNQNDAAGRFGIGFWAVLRFVPDTVFVRSSPRAEPGWELRLSGDLETIEQSTTSLQTGTEIELVRSAGDVDPVRAVWEAIQRDARHLRRRDSSNEILDVRVNSKAATAEIELEPPTLGFSRSGLRGAVALADRPRVDLLAHGLRVRTTATLDELLTGPDRRRRRETAAPEGLVPRVILDSRRLQVLMARGDARTDGELRQLVATGRRGVRRLVRGQLDREAGLGVASRAAMRLREVFSTGWVRKTGIAVAVGVLLTLAGWWSVRAWLNGSVGNGGGGLGFTVKAPSSPDDILRADSSERYHGPAADPLAMVPARLSLRYSPSLAMPMLAVFRVIGLAEDGRVAPGPTHSGLRPYLGSGCSESCLEIVLDLDGVSGDLRLPLPTGHLLDPSSLEVVGGSAALWAAPDGGPLLVVDDPVASVAYRTGPAIEIQVGGGGSWPNLPEPVNGVALGLRGLGADQVAISARDWVRQRVVYDTSESTVERHRVATREGLSFAQRCLTVGAGDCDVQNALLAAVIANAGVPARMAVGFVGADGRALPGLHAWVEYRGAGGMWREVDASRGGRVSPRGEAAPAEEPESVDLVEDGDPTAAKGGSHDFSGLPSPTVVGLILAVVLLGIGAVVMVRRRVVVHQIRSTEVPDLAGLLRGALARPEAYREVPALFSRGVVPSLGGSPFSLDRARSLARKGRLAVSARASAPALGAVENGIPVIDGTRPEGRAVAGVLGAIDLDRWSEILDRGRETPLTQHLVGAAAGVGETWLVMVVSKLSRGIAVLDGELAGFGRGHHVVAVDEDGDLWRSVLQLSPCSASLLLADRVAERLRMPTVSKRRLLSRLAREWALERVASDS
jgi:Histidine kinase-, DNA gyrase B-, and HSP90-like ATPase/Transglutaminase-like superfamily